MFILAALVTLVGCASPGPSEVDIEGVVWAQLGQMVPAFLVKPLNSEDFAGMQGGKDAVIKEIRVIDIGQVRKYPNHEYWPVKVYVEGRCTTMLSGVDREFAGEIEYNISKNSSGEWAVR